MSAEARHTAVSPHRSLRAKIALGVALPIFLTLAGFSVVHFLRERQLVEEQIQLTAQQLGDLTLGSLRHAMEVNDSALLAQILHDVDGMSSIQQVQIIGTDNMVKLDTRSAPSPTRRDLDDPGCVECHRYPLESRPKTVRFDSASDGMLRIAAPIVNGPTCTGCHTQASTHLGVLLVDVSLVGIESHLLDDLRVDLLFSAAATILVTLGIYVLMQRLVVHRIGAMRRPLAEFAAGNFRSRMPVALHPSDEIDALSEAFNHMADELERHTREQKERAEVRQRAIVEERERIARELHDGLAQLLGYVKTKATAVRLMLKNQQPEKAEKHLRQLEEAANASFVDVREAILGLKIAGQDGAGLSITLNEFVTQFRRLSDLPVQLDISPGIDDLKLPAEVELHLVRVVQEALTNVRKHASATQAYVTLQTYDHVLELTIQDDGTGFDPGNGHSDRRAHFGLHTMHERAETIGAEFGLESKPGSGTRIRLRLPLQAS